MKKLFFLFLLIASVLSLRAQTGTYSILNFPNTYTNTITTGFWNSNFRSGFIYETNGSINYGLKGARTSGFRFRWLMHDNGNIDYSTDADQLMQLDNNGICV